ncbi:MAG TPA: hypothetical protein VJR23_10680 [Candidatus Acidoferrales bacterium]|nr:hypothetical protein [Candidatus Acidoferrales bacterium]
MATLYVENVPDEIYEALRNRARARRRSIAAEVVSLLEENIPTERELRARRNFLRKLQDSLARRKPAGNFASTEQTLREDRGR